MRRTLIYLILTVVITSCSTNFSVQKRKYSNGIYFATDHKNRAINNKQIKANTIKEIQEVEPIQQEIVLSQTEEKIIVKKQLVEHSANQNFYTTKFNKHIQVIPLEIQTNNLQKFHQNLSENKLNIKKRLGIKRLGTEQ